MKPLEAGDPTSVGEGRYRLAGRLGQGGMGVVYFGRSRSGRAVAVKVVRPELSTEPGFRRRFADEVAAARRVGGFHTAPVVDADPHGEPAWLVTAFVPGPTLADVLADVGALPTDTLTVLAAGLAEALEAIHRAGVIHRDFKPANIIVAEDGPRVIDFGIARALDGTALTQTGLQIGTPGFLAPEQLTGGQVTAAVDMFALGVVLSQAAGGAPFGDGPSAARHYRVVHETADLRAVPDELRALVAACLSKEAAERPTPSEFLSRLTVRHPEDGEWLPAEATALLTQVEPQAVPPVVPTPPPHAAGPTPASEPTASYAVPLAGSSPSPLASPYGPGQGYGGPPTPAPTPTPGFGPPSGPPRDRRKVTAAVGLVVVAAAVAGALVWHPWTSGSAKDDNAGPPPGGHTTASSSAPPTPAPFPDVPLLVRVDTAPGWPGTCHAYIALRDSTTDRLKRLASGSPCDFLPKWSPDRKTVAFTRRTAQDTSVWTVGADGTGAKRIAETSGGRVSWSPDGGKLAVLRKTGGVQQLYVVDVADGSAQQMTTGSTRIEDPSWSPDGTRIAICVEKGTGNWQINTVDPTTPGAAPQRITDLPRPALDPVWSPDGKVFAYTSGDYGKGTQGDIRLVGTDGTGDRPLAATSAHEMDPDWSPDGTWVAFVRGPLATPEIWAVRADGTGERRLSTDTATEGHPAWAVKGGG
ncbi:hypothetical protein BGM09_11755 [Streptomyces sp. CBMA29]|nr:hypothetical protein [Streptomyces sp. CBMA29]